MNMNSIENRATKATLLSLLKIVAAVTAFGFFIRIIATRPAELLLVVLSVLFVIPLYVLIGVIYESHYKRIADQDKK